MKIYELKNENTIIQFETLGELKEYQKTLENSNDWKVNEIEIEVSDVEPIKVIDYNSLLKESLQFGQQLIDTFLLDNWTSPISINTEQSVSLLNKFETIIKLCNLGDIKNVKVLLENTETDEIFTKERKEKYLEQIKIYLTR